MEHDDYKKLCSWVFSLRKFGTYSVSEVDELNLYSFEDMIILFAQITYLTRTCVLQYVLLRPSSFKNIQEIFSHYKCLSFYILFDKFLKVRLCVVNVKTRGHAL